MKKELAAKVTQNVSRGGGFYVVELETELFSPPDPGQFIMMSVGEQPELTLRRPMAFYDFTSNSNKSLSKVLYSVVGKGTQYLSELKAGDGLTFLGPLGNAFSKPSQGQSTLIVAGGIGIAPFLMWHKKNPSSDHKVLLGFRNEDQASIHHDFGLDEEKLGIAVDQKTNQFFCGSVVDLFLAELESKTPDRVFTCGPDGMMQAVAKICQERKIPCEVSLEARMGCGMGVCLSCVTDFPYLDQSSQPLVCKDGPVFQLFDSAEG